MKAMFCCFDNQINDRPWLLSLWARTQIL